METQTTYITKEMTMGEKHKRNGAVANERGDEGRGGWRV